MTPKQEQRVLDNLDYAKALHCKFCNALDISDRDDYLALAYLGLVEASLKYNEGKAKFTTFAYYQIHNAMYKYYRKESHNLEYQPNITGEIDSDMTEMVDDMSITQTIDKVINIAPLYLNEDEVIKLHYALVLLVEGETKEYVMKVLKVKRYTLTKLLKTGAFILNALLKGQIQV